MIRRRHLISQAGFTLVELLVTVAITGIVGAAILNLYTRNLRTYTGQLQVTEAQQNVRAGIDSLVFDLRMAGYDPGNEAGATITSATTTSISFTQDLNEDDGLIDSEDADGDGNTAEPDMNEDITYSLYPATGIKRLGRDTGSGNQPVAESLDEIGFAYAINSNPDDDDTVPVNRYSCTDSSGTTQDLILWAVPSTPSGGTWLNLDANNDCLITVADDTDSDGTINAVDTSIAVSLDEIRAVKIWLLGRAPEIAQDYTNANSYVVGSQVVPPGNDGYRRRLLTSSVVCRNMGL